jgi:hypothetical protein
VEIICGDNFVVYKYVFVPGFQKPFYMYYNFLKRSSSLYKFFGADKAKKLQIRRKIRITTKHKFKMFDIDRYRWHYKKYVLTESQMRFFLEKYFGTGLNNKVFFLDLSRDLAELFSTFNIYKYSSDFANPLGSGYRTKFDWILENNCWKFKTNGETFIVPLNFQNNIVHIRTKTEQGLEWVIQEIIDPEKYAKDLADWQFMEDLKNGLITFTVEITSDNFTFF